MMTRLMLATLLLGMGPLALAKPIIEKMKTREKNGTKVTQITFRGTPADLHAAITELKRTPFDESRGPMVESTSNFTTGVHKLKIFDDRQPHREQTARTLKEM